MKRQVSKTRNGITRLRIIDLFKPSKAMKVLLVRMFSVWMNRGDHFEASRVLEETPEYKGYRISHEKLEKLSNVFPNKWLNDIYKEIPIKNFVPSVMTDSYSNHYTDMTKDASELITATETMLTDESPQGLSMIYGSLIGIFQTLDNSIRQEKNFDDVYKSIDASIKITREVTKLFENKTEYSQVKQAILESLYDIFKEDQKIVEYLKLNKDRILEKADFKILN